MYNVLFLCTGNSARSILAEAILNQKGKPNFRAFSAGSHPTGRVNPNAIQVLEAARLDFVFTVCDNAANEICPVWPGQPITAHWGVPDPAAATGSQEQIERAFRDTYRTLHRRIQLCLSLPLASLSGLALNNALDGIGRA
jgi:arsenate reductase